MKIKTTLWALLCALLLSCSIETGLTTGNSKTANLVETSGIQSNGNNYTILYEGDLIAGQHMDVGSVTAILIDGNLEVTYQTEGDWEIQETHLYIGSLDDLPATNSGNPKIGKFPNSDTHPDGTTTVTYSWPDFDTEECVYVAAHAVVTNTVTNETETAWGSGEDFGGNSWAMLFQVCYRS